MSFENVFEFEACKPTIAILYAGRPRKILEMLKGNILFTWKERKRELASGASEQIFEFTPSRTLENDLFGILYQLSMSVSITEWCRIYRLEQIY